MNKKIVIDISKRLTEANFVTNNFIFNFENT